MSYINHNYIDSRKYIYDRSFACSIDFVAEQWRKRFCIAERKREQRRQIFAAKVFDNRSFRSLGIFYIFILDIFRFFSCWLSRWLN